MRCPFCSHEETQVVETRDSDEGDVVRRRRRCHACDKRFTTYERAEIALPSVVKKDGTREEFAIAKVRGSMTLALRKRPVSVEQIDAAIERIQDKLLNSGAKEVPSTRLGRTGDARAQAHRQSRVRALRVGVSQLRGRRRVPSAHQRHLSVSPR